MKMLTEYFLLSAFLERVYYQIACDSIHHEQVYRPQSHFLLVFNLQTRSDLELDDSDPLWSEIRLSLSIKSVCCDRDLNVTLLSNFDNSDFHYEFRMNHHQFLGLQTHNCQLEGVKMFQAFFPAKPISQIASSFSNLVPSLRL